MDSYAYYIKNQLPHERAWLENQLATKKLTQKNYAEYKRQLRHLDLAEAFHNYDLENHNGA